MATYENRLKMQYLMRYIDSKRRARAILNEIHDLKDLATSDFRERKHQDLRRPGREVLQPQCTRHGREEDHLP